MSGCSGSRASALTAFSTLAVNWREPSSGCGDIGLPIRTRTRCQGAAASGLGHDLIRAADVHRHHRRAGFVGEMPDPGLELLDPPVGRQLPPGNRTGFHPDLRSWLELWSWACAPPFARTNVFRNRLTMFPSSGRLNQ
jgi:hypothetical protein